MNLAISVIGEFMVMVAGFVLPLKLPVPVPFQELNLWPTLGKALIVTVCPASRHPLLGEVVPIGPLTFMVR